MVERYFHFFIIFCLIIFIPLGADFHKYFDLYTTVSLGLPVRSDAVTMKFIEEFYSLIWPYLWFTELRIILYVLLLLVLVFCLRKHPILDVLGVLVWILIVFSGLDKQILATIFLCFAIMTLENNVGVKKFILFSLFFLLSVLCHFPALSCLPFFLIKFARRNMFEFKKFFILTISFLIAFAFFNLFYTNEFIVHYLENIHLIRINEFNFGFGFLIKIFIIISIILCNYKTNLDKFRIYSFCILMLAGCFIASSNFMPVRIEYYLFFIPLLMYFSGYIAKFNNRITSPILLLWFFGKLLMLNHNYFLYRPLQSTDFFNFAFY